MNPEPRLGRHHAQGLALIDALIALLVLCVAAVATTRLSAAMRHSADLSRQQAHAVRIGQSILDRLRNQAASPPASPTGGYERIASTGEAAGVTTDRTTPWRMAIDVTATELPAYKSARVTIAWQDSARQPQAMSLTTIIAPMDPRFTVIHELRRTMPADPEPVRREDAPR